MRREREEKEGEGEEESLETFQSKRWMQEGERVALMMHKLGGLMGPRSSLEIPSEKRPGKILMPRAD